MAQSVGMDLEATKGGRIVGMVTRSGVPMVKIEDEVEDGAGAVELLLE